MGKSKTGRCGTMWIDGSRTEDDAEMDTFGIESSEWQAEPGHKAEDSWISLHKTLALDILRGKAPTVLMTTADAILTAC